MQINKCDTLCFKMKSDSKASKKVLKVADPKLKTDIQNGLNAFCDITQKRGIKGSVVLKSLDGDILTFTVKPTSTNEVRKLSINTKVYQQKGRLKKGELPINHSQEIKHRFLRSIDYLFEQNDN